MSKGFVTLVGAGPGDPELITRKGYEALQQADVVITDYLIAQSFTGSLPSKAKHFIADCQKGSSCRIERVKKLLVDHGNSGAHVVRLKGGDPFIFGRIDEELGVLIEHQIPFTVIPGLSSVTSVATQNMIPLTMRGVASNFAVFSGHGTSEKGEPCVDWNLAAKIDTAVFLMGTKYLRFISTKLIEAGRDPTTPVVIVENGTLENEKVYKGSLEFFSETPVSPQSPALIIVGEVAAPSLAIETLRLHGNATVLL